LGDALLNGLPAETFDAVIAIESTEHIAAKTKLFYEARRILRAGGRFVVTAWLARASRDLGNEVSSRTDPRRGPSAQPGVRRTNF